LSKEHGVADALTEKISVNLSTRNVTVKMAGPAVVQFLCFGNSMLSAHLPCISSACVSRTKINVNFGERGGGGVFFGSKGVG